MSLDAHQHYIYRLTDCWSGEFYVGVRMCRCAPALDKQYMGSGRWPRHVAYDRRPIRKEVLATFDTRALAEEAELLLIDMVVGDRLCRNSIKTASEDIKAPRRTKRGYE